MVASGALTVYLYTRILALFSAAPYVNPSEQGSDPDLVPHLTNTSLQTDRGEAGVRLLDNLIGSSILSANDSHGQLTEDHIKHIIQKISEILAETFKAALENPVHFQVGLYQLICLAQDDILFTAASECV